MWVIFVAALLGTITAAPSPLKSLTTMTGSSRSENYRLPGESFPTFYDIRLFLNPNNPVSFSGNVTIRAVSYNTTQQLVLHAMEMNINGINIFSDLNPNVDLYSGHTLATDDTHFLTININRILNPYEVININIDYVGQYAANMFGVYVSTYTTANNDVRNLITSQLQPTFARRAFPCYDEPALKAIFRQTIYAPAEFTTVLSNMPERTGQGYWPDVVGFVRHEFEDTVVMSTYLIALLVSDFVSLDNTNNPLYRLPFRVFSRPEAQDSTAFALDFGQRNMVGLEEYTNLPYAFPKMDKVAVPDFAAGAMENWGLVIYREAALLVEDGTTTTSSRQSIGRIICHENMHQWYGNEVSPLWWSYTWLNEGFANFFESFATDFVYPNWRMMDQFVIAMQNVMQADAVLAVNPMTTAVYTPSEVLGNFNSVAYQKSGSVIRMIQHFMTPDIYRQGLAIYLNQNARSAVGPDQLYAALQQAIDESETTIPFPISSILQRWTEQSGFPIVTARRTAPDANSISFIQERYLTDTSLTDSTTWHIPINYVFSNNPNFSDTSPQVWMNPTLSAAVINFPNLLEVDWFIVNKQQTGYYRVNYDVDNWRALSRQLNSDNFNVIHLLNRAQLIDDAFNVARTGRLDYEVVFELFSYLRREKDYIPWAAANAGIAYLNTVLTGSDTYENFQRFVLQLTEPLFQELGFVAATGEDHVTAFHRNNILNWNCRFGNPSCINSARDQLQQFQADTSQRLNPDIQAIVFCSSLRGGTSEDFDFFWNWFTSTNNPSEQSILLSAMGCTSNEEKRQFYMNQVIDDDSPVREQDKSSILTAVINSSPENMDAAFDFLIDNFADIQPRVQQLTGTTNILNVLANHLSSQEHERKLEEFIARYDSIFSAGELASLNAARENLQASRMWASTYQPAIDTWLIENVSGASALYTSAMLLTSLIVLLNLM